MDTEGADGAALFPLGKIASLQFSVATTEEIVKASTSEPIKIGSQLFGPGLGLPTGSNRCLSCGAVDINECEGHFGHIRLPTPVYHPSHIQELVRVLKRICLNCLQLKKKKTMNFVKEILQAKNPIIGGGDLDDTKSSASINCVRKDNCNPGHDATVTNASSTSEEDPLLRSLIPFKTYRRRNAIHKQRHDSQASENFNAIKVMARESKQHKKPSAVLGKRTFTSFMEDTECSKDTITCKYCKAAKKQSIESYPAVEVKVALAQCSNNGKLQEIKISARNEVPHKFWDFVDRHSGHQSSDELSRTLFPFEALNILRKLPQATLRKLGIKPEAFIWECLPVPPNCTRISGESFETARRDIDGASRILKKLLNTVGRIRESRGGKPTLDTKKYETRVLQSLCTEYLRARGGPKVPGDNETSDFYAQKIGKAESLSKVWGKRIQALFLKKMSGFSARSVITGDAYIDIDEIGVPLQLARGLTIEERVTVYNKKKLQNIVNEGFYTTLVDRDGNVRLKEYLKAAKMVEVGDVIRRQLKDGDTVIVNRPPTIHKHSIQALKVRTQPSCNMSISPLICPPMDADFDGDCIHVFVPQSLQSQAELSQLLTVDQQLISCHGGQTLLTLTQDTLLAANLLLSMPFLDKVIMQSLSMWTLSSLPDPAIVRSPLGAPYWTGSQLFQMCLPPGLNCMANGLHIHNSEILSLPRSRKQLPGCIDLMLHDLIQQKGPSEALEFLNSAQHCLTEWLSQDGFSVGLNDIHPFHEPSCKQELSKIIDECIDDVAPLMKRVQNSSFGNMIIPFVQNHVREANKKLSNHISESNSLVSITVAGSGRAINKVVQQTGLLGLQTFKGKELLPSEWSNRLSSLLHGSKPERDESNYCEIHGLIGASFVDGLKPHEAFIHAVSAREILFHRSIEMKEPGKLFKNLMAFLRDIIICYDGTARTALGKHLVQFHYDCNASPEESRSKKQSLERVSDNFRLKTHLEVGEPVGILAATSIANLSYKALLETAQGNMSSWHLLKETLFRRFGSDLQLEDRKVTLCLQSCCCSRAYCHEKTALQIQRYLQRVPLKMFAVCIEVGYQSTDAMHDFPETSFSTNSHFLGHIRLDRKLLEEENLSMDSLLSNLKSSIKRKRNPLNDFLGKLILFSCDNCNGVANSGTLDFEMPCLHFYLDTSETINESILDMMVNVLCPKLLETTAKGDDRIESVRILWSAVNSASWVPLQTSSSQYVEGNICLEVTVKESEVKKRADAWKIVLDACVPVMNLLDYKRCVPYSIHDIQKCFGVSAAYYSLLQRIMLLINTMGSLVNKEHLVLLSNCMAFCGNILGFTAASYREFLCSIEMAAPFTKGALQMPIKCFQKAAEKGEEDSLSSTFALCSWGQNPPLGTGGQFEILWNNVQGAIDPLPSLSEHADVHNFLENMGMIPCGRETSSAVSDLSAGFGDQIDDPRQFRHLDDNFGAAPTAKWKTKSENYVSVWDSAAKSPTEDSLKTNNISGWEASTKAHPQSDEWGWSSPNIEASECRIYSGDKLASDCLANEDQVKSTASPAGYKCESDQANEEAGNKNSQSKVVNGWGMESALSGNDQTNEESGKRKSRSKVVDGREMDSALWMPNRNVSNENDSKRDGKENELIDFPGQNLSLGIIGEEQDCTDGWKNPGISTTLENNSPKSTSKSDKKCAWQKSWQEDQIATVSGWNSNVGTAGENDCTIGWQKSHTSSTSKEDNWKYSSTDEKRDCDSGWKEKETSNFPGWNSNTDTVDCKDCTGWQNQGSRKKNQWDISKWNDNQSIESGGAMDNWSSRDLAGPMYKHKPFGKSFKQRNVKGSQDRNEETVPLELEDSPFPPGFHFQDSLSGKNLYKADQTGQDNEIWPSKELQINPTGANLVPLGKTRLFSKIPRFQQVECDRNASGEHEQDQQPPAGGQSNSCLIIEEPDTKSRHAESSIQDTCAGKDSTAINGEVTIIHGHSNMETRKDNAVDTFDERYSDRQNPSPDIAEGSGWEVWHNEHVTCEKGVSDPSGQEFPVQSSKRMPKRPYMTKKVGSLSPSNDTVGVASLWHVNKNKLHPEYKNENVRNDISSSSNAEKIVQETYDNPPELQVILQEINPLLYSMRRILHFSRYDNGERLRVEDEREVLEKIFVHHPELEAKMGCGVDFIMIDNHSEFKLTRCFYIVRNDGSREDFSYKKCLRALVENKYPDSAKAFIEKYLPERK